MPQLWKEEREEPQEISWVSQLYWTRQCGDVPSHVFPSGPPTLFSIFAFKKGHWETTSSTQRNEYLIGCLSDTWKEGEGDLLWCQVLPANPVEATVFGWLGWALHNYMWHSWIATWRNVFSGRKFAGLSFYQYMHSEQNLHCKISQIAPEFPLLLLHGTKSFVLFKDQFNCWWLWSSPWRPTPSPRN